MNDDPYFPESFVGRIKLAAESIFFLIAGVTAVFQWPPAGVKGKGLFVDVALTLLFEMMLALIPLSILGLWWAVAMPEWIRLLMSRALRHLDLVVLLFVVLGLLGMLGGWLGWL